MARIEPRFIDAAGVAHRAPEDAARADLTRVIVGTKAAGSFSVSSSIAGLILEHREEIELIFTELDAARLHQAEQQVVSIKQAKARR